MPLLQRNTILYALRKKLAEGVKNFFEKRVEGPEELDISQAGIEVFAFSAQETAT